MTNPVWRRYYLLILFSKSMYCSCFKGYIISACFLILGCLLDKTRNTSAWTGKDWKGQLFSDITNSVIMKTLVNCSLSKEDKVIYQNILIHIFIYLPQMSWRPTYRSSKFRNVYGKVANREHCFDGIPITKNVHDNHFCAVNSKFVAVVTESAGGGSFIVIPVSQVTSTVTHTHLLFV